MPTARSDDERIGAALRALGIPDTFPRERGLRRYREARRLVPMGLGSDQRDKFLAPAAAQAWLAMRAQASRDAVDLQLVSGFRSIDFQSELIRSKLRRGLALDTVLRVNAPPGYSEHHSGRAVDIGTTGCAALDEAFENTEAFSWLQRRAAGFGFRLSYPRANREGFLYEPWHWYHATGALRR